MNGQHQPHLDARHLHGKQRKAEYQRQTRAALAARGLTVRGTARQVKLWPQLAGLDRRTAHRLRVRSYYKQRTDAGLTCRGTVRVNGQLPAREAAWRTLRSGMELQPQAA